MAEENFIGKRLKEARLDLQKTQVEVAEMLRITPKTYARYELGQYTIPPHRLKVVASVLNVNSGWLLGLATKEPSTESEAISLIPKLNFVRESIVSDSAIGSSLVDIDTTLRKIGLKGSAKWMKEINQDETDQVFMAMRLPVREKEELKNTAAHLGLSVQDTVRFAVQLMRDCLSSLQNADNIEE